MLVIITIEEGLHKGYLIDWEGSLTLFSYPFCESDGYQPQTCFNMDMDKVSGNLISWVNKFRVKKDS